MRFIAFGEFERTLQFFARCSCRALSLDLGFDRTCGQFIPNSSFLEQDRLRDAVTGQVDGAGGKGGIYAGGRWRDGPARRAKIRGAKIRVPVTGEAHLLRRTRQAGQQHRP